MIPSQAFVPLNVTIRIWIPEFDGRGLYICSIQTELKFKVHNFYFSSLFILLQSTPLSCVARWLLPVVGYTPFSGGALSAILPLCAAIEMLYSVRTPESNRHEPLYDMLFSFGYSFLFQSRYFKIVLFYILQLS